MSPRLLHYWVCALLVLAACSNRASDGAWFHPSGPFLNLEAADGCPANVWYYGDVAGTWAGPTMVPPSPTAAILCRYGPRPGSGLPHSGELLASARLDNSQADELARVIDTVEMSAPSGLAKCANDTGTLDIIGFRYSSRRDVGVWHPRDGCQTIDNGRIGASIRGNPTFGAFQDALQRLCPVNDQPQ